MGKKSFKLVRSMYKKLITFQGPQTNIFGNKVICLNHANNEKLNLKKQNQSRSFTLESIQTMFCIDPNKCISVSDEAIFKL